MAATYGRGAWGVGKYSADDSEVILSGNLVPQAVLGGTLTAIRPLAAEGISPSVVFSGDQNVGGLWVQSTLCVASWQETVLCDG